jgi:hypothetical protein
VAFATSQQVRLASILDNPKSSAIMAVTLDGRPAIHFEVEGVSRKAPHFGLGYVGTVIQGEVEIAYLVAWTYAAAFPAKKDALAHVAGAVVACRPRRALRSHVSVVTKTAWSPCRKRWKQPRPTQLI